MLVFDRTGKSGYVAFARSVVHSLFMRGGNIGKRGFPLQREAECRELVYSVRPCGRMVVVYIYDLEYIEAEELVRGTVFDGEDVESHGPTR